MTKPKNPRFAAIADEVDPSPPPEPVKVKPVSEWAATKGPDAEGIQRALDLRIRRAHAHEVLIPNWYEEGDNDDDEARN